MSTTEQIVVNIAVVVLIVFGFAFVILYPIGKLLMYRNIFRSVRQALDLNAMKQAAETHPINVHRRKKLLPLWVVLTIFFGLAALTFQVGEGFTLLTSILLSLTLMFLTAALGAMFADRIEHLRTSNVDRFTKLSQGTWLLGLLFMLSTVLAFFYFRLSPLAYAQYIVVGIGTFGLLNGIIWMVRIGKTDKTS